MKTLRLISILVLAAASLEARPQDAQKEYDLTWKLPHDRAVVYDIYEPVKGVKEGEFCLLGCELTSGVCANEPQDLAYAYLFRSSNRKYKVGAIQAIEEDVFNKSLNMAPAPLQVKGFYVLRAIKKCRMSEVVKSARNRKDKSEEAEDLAIIEGQFEIRPYRIGVEPRIMEKRVTATLATVAVVRVADGVLRGGRIQWMGRLERYSLLESPSVGKVSDTWELVGSGDSRSLAEIASNEEIEGAVKAGCSWLRGKQETNGRIADGASYAGLKATDSGATALALLALLCPSGNRVCPGIGKGGMLWPFNTEERPWQPQTQTDGPLCGGVSWLGGGIAPGGRASLSTSGRAP
jgi:hypothetical protein